MADAVLPFYLFCPRVLKLNLTNGQNVIAKVAFGDFNPCDLEGEERELARELFGGLDRVDAKARKLVVMRLGRGSGKTTLCAAYALYVSLTADVSMCGPGDVPYFIIIAPDKPLAQLSVRMCREMARMVKEINRLVVSDTATGMQLRRPDGHLVRIEAFAAARAGTPVRGKTIIGWTGDEAEFFTSNEDGTTDFAVNDKEIFRSMKPRMTPEAKGMLISTPWPVPTYMSSLFDENWGKSLTALAIKAPTLLVRGDDAAIREMIEDELTKDPENARRELFCEVDGFGTGDFFDPNALFQALEPTNSFPIEYNPRWPVAVGCDLGFTRDSSAICVTQFDGKNYRPVFLEEMKPTGGKPLQPSKVIKRIAEVAKLYQATGVIADSYYREALREQLLDHNLVVIGAPEGVRGKAEVFQRTRAVLHEGRVKLPDTTIIKRLIQQAKLVVSKPAPGGTVTIRIPRKIGMGHGDLVSAWTLAVHALAYDRVKEDKIVYEIGSPEWIAESNRRLLVAHEKQQNDYLKQIEAEERRKLGRNGYKRVLNLYY